MVARAEREGWYLSEHFKLHVHPSSMSATHFGNLIPFPPQVTIERIYADLLRYLFDRTKRYFEEKEFEFEGAKQIWNRLESGNAIDFVLCHPTGWGISEQMMLRNAVVDAKLAPSMQIAEEHVQFLGEAEASVHFVMSHADLQSRLQVSVSKSNIHDSSLRHYRALDSCYSLESISLFVTQAAQPLIPRSTPYRPSHLLLC